MESFCVLVFLLPIPVILDHRAHSPGLRDILLDLCEGILGNPRTDCSQNLPRPGSQLDVLALGGIFDFRKRHCAELYQRLAGGLALLDLVGLESLDEESSLAGLFSLGLPQYEDHEQAQHWVIESSNDTG